MESKDVGECMGEPKNCDVNVVNCEPQNCDVVKCDPRLWMCGMHVAAVSSFPVRAMKKRHMTSCAPRPLHCQSH